MEEEGAHPVNVQAGQRAENGWQLLDVVLLHAVAPPRLLRGVQVEARPGAKVVRVVLPRHAQPPRRGVGRDQRHARGGRRPLGAGLLNEVLVRAGEPRQVVDQRYRGGLRGGREEDCEVHAAPQKKTVVAVAADEPAEALQAGGGKAGRSGEGTIAGAISRRCQTWRRRGRTHRPPQITSAGSLHADAHLVGLEQLRHGATHR
jgi:hypothetical protein